MIVWGVAVVHLIDGKEQHFFGTGVAAVYMCHYLGPSRWKTIQKQKASRIRSLLETFPSAPSGSGKQPDSLAWIPAPNWTLSLTMFTCAPIMPSFQYFDLVTVSWPKNVSISMFLTNNMLHYVNVTQICQHEFSFFSTPNANKVFIRPLIVINISMHQIFYYNYGCYDYEFNNQFDRSIMFTSDCNVA